MYCKWKTVLALTLLTSTFSAMTHADDKNKEAANIDYSLKLAGDTKAKIESNEEQLDKNMEELFSVIDQKLNGLPDSIADEQAAVDTMLIATQRLNALAKTLIEKYEGYSENRSQYLKILPTAATVFRQAAQTYKEYADQEPYASIAADYRVLASAWETAATVYEKRAKDIGSETDLAETMQFVKRSSIFLSRLETHLSVYPKGSVGPELEAFHRQLRTYIEGFEQLRLRIRTLDQQFKKNLDPGNTTEHKQTESLTLYIGPVKVVTPNADAAKTVKAALKQRNIEYDLQPFESNKFYSLIANEGSSIRPASYHSSYSPPADDSTNRRTTYDSSTSYSAYKSQSRYPAYEPEKMKTVPELIERVNKLPPPSRTQSKPAPKQSIPAPNRDRTTRYAPPPRYFAPPPPPVVLVHNRILVGPNGLPIYPPPVFVMNYPVVIHHR
jgi:hypothetical protein